MIYEELEAFAQFPLDTGRQVVFLHLPKTAGTSFRVLLSREFADNEICPWYFMDESPAKIDGYRLYAGHFYFSAIRQFVAANALYLTFIRSPLERTISDYYEKLRAVSQMPNFLTEMPRSLEEMIFDPNFNHLVKNVQTRVLGTRINYDQYPDIATAHYATAEAYRNGAVVHAESVYEIIDSLAFIGITERYDESLAVYFESFGVAPMYNAQKLNVDSTRPPHKQLPRHVVDQIMALNQEDQKLYDYACRVFDARYRQVMQRLSYRSYAQVAISKTPRVSQFVFNPDRQPNETWYKSETTDDNLHFVWSGPEPNSYITAALQPDIQYLLHLHILSAANESIYDSFAVYVNGVHIPLVAAPSPSGGFNFEGIIPARAVNAKRYFTRIEFVVAQTVLVGGTDAEHGFSRKVGIALASMRIEPSESANAAIQPRLQPELTAMLTTNLETIRMPVNARISLDVLCQNTSNTEWLGDSNAAGTLAVRLGCYWTDGAGLPRPECETRAFLSRDIKPGSTENVRITLAAPSDPGQYSAHLNMLLETVAWFSSPPLDIPVEVTA